MGEGRNSLFAFLRADHKPLIQRALQSVAATTTDALTQAFRWWSEVERRGL